MSVSFLCVANLNVPVHMMRVFIEMVFGIDIIHMDILHGFILVDQGKLR